jgi:hypothetical protein
MLEGPVRDRRGVGGRASSDATTTTRAFKKSTNVAYESTERALHRVARRSDGEDVDTRSAAEARRASLHKQR